MVAIGPRGTAYTAAAFEIFADLYYRTSAIASSAANHISILVMLDENTLPVVRTELARRVLTALRQSLAPIATALPGMAQGIVAPDALAVESRPAAFVLEAVWHRIASRPDSAGALGAGYLAAESVAQILQQPAHVTAQGLTWDGSVPEGNAAADSALRRLGIEARLLATALRHMLLEELSRNPESAPAIFSGFDRLAVVFPAPLLDDTLTGLTDNRELA